MRKMNKSKRAYVERIKIHYQNFINHINILASLYHKVGHVRSIEIVSKYAYIEDGKLISSKNKVKGYIESFHSLNDIQKAIILRDLFEIESKETLVINYYSTATYYRWRASAFKKFVRVANKHGL